MPIQGIYSEVPFEEESKKMLNRSTSDSSLERQEQVVIPKIIAPEIGGKIVNGHRNHNHNLMLGRHSSTPLLTGTISNLSGTALASRKTTNVNSRTFRFSRMIQSQSW